jgi:N utilization substance protein B
VLQALYAWLVQGDAEGIGAIEAHIREDAEFSGADQAWFVGLLKGITNNAATLRETFEPFIDRPIVELSPIEHGILLIGTFELTHQLDVPYRVAINEAVELAKSFGGTDGFKYVNGVLDKVAANARSAEVNRAPVRR